MNLKIIAVALCAVLAIGFCAGCSSNSSSLSSDLNIPAAETEQNAKEDPSFIQDDPILNKNFDLVCSTVGIDTDEILSFEQKDDWAGGIRYTFIYHKAPFMLYCNTDSTINALQIGIDTDVFKQGFEPYNVSDFIATDAEKVELQIHGEDTIKAHLNHPETADFHTMDWKFGKSYDLYKVSGSVTAENSFGVKDRLQFSVVYHVHDKQMTPIYISLDDSILLNEMEAPSEQTRAEADDIQEVNPKESEAENIGEDAGILLEDGSLGEYGVEDNIGGEIYIDYYVPSDHYTVINLAAPCKVYVINNESNEPDDTIDLAENGEGTLQVAENQHIELTMYAKIVLKPVE